MRVVLGAVKSLFAAGLVSIVIRIVFGMYSVFGVPSLIAPAVIGTLVAAYLIPKGCDRFFGKALSHMVLVTAIFALTDYFGLFCSVGVEAQSFFSDTFGRAVSHGILISIVCTTAAYFVSLIVASVIIASSHARRIRKSTKV